MKIRRKLISLLAAFMLALSLFAGLPLTTSAATPVCELNGTTYTTLDDALANLQGGRIAVNRLKLLQDIDYSGCLNFSDINVIFDLNHKSLKISNTNPAVSDGKAIVLNNAYISYINGGKFEAYSSVNDVVELTGGMCALTSVEQGADNGKSAITAFSGAEGGAEVTVNGDVTSPKGDNGCFIAEGSTLTVNGNLTAGGAAGVIAYDDGTQVVVNGNVTAPNGCGVDANLGAQVTVKGKISAPDSVTLGGSPVSGSGTAKPGYLTYTDGTSTVWAAVPAPVCQIGATSYNTLDAAVAAIPAYTSGTTTIKLLSNINHTDGFEINNKNIIFDLNKKNLVFSDSTDRGVAALELMNCNVDYKNPGAFQVRGSMLDGLSISGGSCKLTSAVTTDASENSAVDAAYGGKVTVNGNVKTETTGVFGDTGSNIVVNGNITTTENGVQTYDPGAKVTVNGNIIVTSQNDYASAAEAYAGTINVNGNVTATVSPADPKAYVVDAPGGAITVTGSVTLPQTMPGAHAGANSSVDIRGTLTANPAKTAGADSNGKVSLGRVAAGSQVTIGSANFLINPGDAHYLLKPTTKTGYLTYTDDVAIPANRSGYIWIRSVDIAKQTVVKAIPAQTWAGSQRRPAVTVTALGYKLLNGTDYTVSYGANKNIGKGTVKITGKGLNFSSKTLTFKILPKTLALVKATAGKNKVTLKWKKPASAQKITGFNVRYKAAGASKWKTKTIKAKYLTASITKLQKGKKYQFQIRAYKKVSGSPYYSAWSKTKTSGKVK